MTVSMTKYSINNFFSSLDMNTANVNGSEQWAKRFCRHIYLLWISHKVHTHKTDKKKKTKKI